MEVIQSGRGHANVCIVRRYAGLCHNPSKMWVKKKTSLEDINPE